MNIEYLSVHGPLLLPSFEGVLQGSVFERTAFLRLCGPEVPILVSGELALVDFPALVVELARIGGDASRVSELAHAAARRGEHTFVHLGGELFTLDERAALSAWLTAHVVDATFVGIPALLARGAAWAPDAAVELPELGVTTPVPRLDVHDVVQALDADLAARGMPGEERAAVRDLARLVIV